MRHGRGVGGRPQVGARVREGGLQRRVAGVRGRGAVAAPLRLRTTRPHAAAPATAGICNNTKNQFLNHLQYIRFLMPSHSLLN